MSSARATRLAVTVLVALIAIGPAACGGDESESDGGAESSGQGRQGFAQDPEVAACLEEEGVELPERPEGAPPEGEPPQGTPPAGGQGPPGGEGFGGDSEQAQALRDALEKCGVEMPQPPEGGAPEQ